MLPTSVSSNETQQNSRALRLPAKDTQLRVQQPPLDSNYTGIIKLTFKTEDQWNLLHANMGRFRGVMSLNREEKMKNPEICNKCWVWYWSGWVCTEQWTRNVLNHRPANERWMSNKSKPILEWIICSIQQVASSNIPLHHSQERFSSLAATLTLSFPSLYLPLSLYQTEFFKSSLKHTADPGHPPVNSISSSPAPSHNITHAWPVAKACSPRSAPRGSLVSSNEVN